MILAPRALKDTEEIYAYVARDAPAAAERWIVELFEAVEGLGRCAPAPEDSYLRAGLRQRLFGNYRILFIVDEESRVVNVPPIRHAAREPLDREDVESLRSRLGRGR